MLNKKVKPLNCLASHSLSRCCKKLNEKYLHINLIWRCSSTPRVEDGKTLKPSPWFYQTCGQFLDHDSSRFFTFNDDMDSAQMSSGLLSVK
jgi:hypothetical protein